MPTDTPTTEHEMAREALLLLRPDTLCRIECPMQWRDASKAADRAADIMVKHGPCPGFWAEVLAAVRVLADWPVCAISQPKVDGHFWTITLPWTDAPRTITAATEPAAILAALRAVVGAADV